VPVLVSARNCIRWCRAWDFLGGCWLTPGCGDVWNVWVGFWKEDEFVGGGSDQVGEGLG